MKAVTVIMPIRNEIAYIERSLGSVLAQDYPADLMQVIVADGMSADGTRDTVRRVIAEERGRDIELIDNPDQVVPAGFNKALQHASGDIIVRVDGHCELESDYVRRCVELLEEKNADNVGGRQEAIGSGIVANTISLATSSPFGVGNASFHYADEAGWVETVYLGAWPRRVFDRIGGFDAELVRNQDDEFNYRLIQAGGKIWFDPSVRAVYYSRPNISKLWSQYCQYGFYKVRVIQKRGAVPSWRHLVPGTFVLALVIGLFTWLLTGEVVVLAGVGIPYIAACMIASVLTARRDWKTLPLLPVAFATLHLGYGVGFLKGLWHWRKGWKSVERLQTSGK